MFKFLKDKIKSAVSRFTQKVEETVKESNPGLSIESNKSGTEDPTEKTAPTTPESSLQKQVSNDTPPVIQAQIVPPTIQDTGRVPPEERNRQPADKTPKFAESKQREHIEEIRDQPYERSAQVNRAALSTPQETKGLTRSQEAKHSSPKISEVKGGEHSVLKKPQSEKTKEISPEIASKPSGFFATLKQKIITKKLTQNQFEALFQELEFALLENNMAVEIVDTIKENLHKDLVEKPIARSKIGTIVLDSLHTTIDTVLSFESPDIIANIKAKKPYIFCFVGINGSGKTTTIAKFAHLLKEQKLRCVMAAGDTFRAAAIQQLEEHANRLDVKIIKHDYGSDSAAVAFDAIAYAKAHHIDAVLIDTAGRLHSNINLMEELRKVIRIAKPDMTIFVGESITGNDCVEQAEKFNAAIGIDGIVLTKADVDEKGGAAVSISYVTGTPILYFGVGQGYADLKAFNKKTIMENIGL